MDILITGARAPVALDWARIVIQSGHRVWLADSLHYPLGRYLTGIQGYIQLPAPNICLTKYAQALQSVITKHQIDWVIPTCEEVFYLAQARQSITATVHWWMPDSPLLFQLHHKFEGLALLQGLGEVHIPATRLLSHPDAVQEDPNTILKPVYSRFGRDVIRSPYHGCLGPNEISENQLWVQQQKLTGTAICNYAIFEHGNLIAHQAYLPKYCLNQSAASYFEPYQDERLTHFCHEFGQRTHYHGQVAFDFIEQNNTLFVIECNPRATSGLHLLRSALTLSSDGQLSYQPLHTATAKRAGASLLVFFGLKAFMRGQWQTLLKDHRRAQDALNDPYLPLPKLAQWRALSEMIYRALRFRRPLTQASTFDIEWNGPTHNEKDIRKDA